MDIIVIGGTGFIGRALVAELLKTGHGVVVPCRSASRCQALFGAQVDCVSWDGVDPEPLVSLMSRSDGSCAVINLAGEGIADGRWSEDKKARILDSRIRATEAVTSAALMADTPPSVSIQGSAVGYYGAQASAQDRILDEARPRGDGFLAEVCEAWEAAGASVVSAGTRRVIVRTGLVIGQGGVLAKFLPPFRFFVGGPLGSGQQWMPWIHLSDQVGAICWLLENEQAQGVYNLCAPVPVTMMAFCKALGRVLRRPSWLPVPSLVLRLMLGGEMANETVLASQRAVPTRLLSEGYQFRMMEIEAALQDSIRMMK